MNNMDYRFLINQVKKYDSQKFIFYIKIVLKRSEIKIDDLSLIYGTIEPIQITEKQNYNEEKYDFNDVIYYSKFLDCNELINLLEIFGSSTQISLGVEQSPLKYKISTQDKKILQSEERVIKIKDDIEISLNGLSKVDKINYYERSPILNRSDTDSHTGYYEIDFSSKNTNLYIISNLVAKKSPYYPSIADLILEKYELDISRYNACQGKLHLKISSNYIGRIEKLEYIDNRIEFKVQLLDKINAILKIFIKDQLNNIGESFSFNITKNITEDSIGTSFEPNWIDAVLIDEDLNIIHKISKPKSLPSIYSKKPSVIKTKILEGEGVRCDFKKELPTNNDKIVKLICALSNTEGGDIILGVDNDANIIGLIYNQQQFPTKFDDIEVCVQNLINSNIDPPARVEGFTVILKDLNNNDQEIGVLRVYESNVIVKNLIDNEYYIRQGSTNRIAKSVELNELIKRKNKI